ncbi:PepSY-associated TM helix domain-containing protein [Mucilaginibacter jinjuensis]|uniref:PepSY-associated TM helix domain-containing protein n=1 Tax=Mucilaginibacter jinjuensis TaxID=1176721 RepID=A0ABY7T6J0_9SPHI|nr:PepSY-associated TM helix domain-containing protein [Mucilaginibacter jinjuensis]WCT10867.1 PepSY-associated TM helix domain-containing protein [Mucilaginibacter jinjuensis]
MMESKLKNKLRKNFYQLHRMVGLIALVPVICWTLSGLSHPFMSNWFRPFIPQEVFKPLTQDKMQPKLSVQQVMDQNHLGQIRNFGLVNFNNSTWYQVLLKDSTYKYYSATNGSLFPDGDQAYAVYLTRFFTEDSISPVKRIRLQTKFDSEYQPINHLLPVWKVQLNRPDGMTIYVETGQSRLATFNNNTRKIMLGLFEEFHTWQFLGEAGGEKLRIIVLTCIIGLLFVSLLTGVTVYGLFWKRFKEIAQKRKAKGGEDKRFVHRFHRQLGLIVSFVMLTFVISAAFHLLVKLHNLKPESKPFEQRINRNELVQSNLNLPVADSVIRKVSVIKFNNHVYYQVLKKNKQMDYVDVQNGELLKDGDQQLAISLAGYYRAIDGRSSSKPDSVTLIKQFNNDYGFNNKRLPVEQVSYKGENWYVETATAKLSTKTAGIDRAEGLSFIFLHKYFGMTWAGKDIRDIVTMLAALGILVASLFGFAAFIKNN